MKGPKLLTLCFLFQGDEVLLGEKKRGFGQGKWNGFGGKLENEESIEDAMKREVLEEIGVEVLSFKKVGIIWETHPSWPQALEVHIFVSKEFKGIPSESEEMRPQWFKLTEIPYESMWEGDKVWIPKAISEEIFTLSIELDFDFSILKARSV